MIKINTRPIDISENTRPNEKLKGVYKIVLPDAPIKNKSGIKNRNYINNLKYQDDIFSSYHYIIGINGEIINLIPEDEVSIHTGNIEFDFHSISIAICSYNLNKISSKTLNSLSVLSNYLLKKYNLNHKYDLIRCYDIINKRSPIFFVDNPYLYYDFKETIYFLCNHLQHQNN